MTISVKSPENVKNWKVIVDEVNKANVLTERVEKRKNELF